MFFNVCLLVDYNPALHLEVKTRKESESPKG